jgi:hypothetical protein
MNIPELISLPFVFFFGCALSCGMICTWVFHVMRLEINEKLPDQEKIGVLFGYPGLLFKVEKLHRRFYPRSRLRTVLNVFIALGLLCVFVMARTLQ